MLTELHNYLNQTNETWSGFATYFGDVVRGVNGRVVFNDIEVRHLVDLTIVDNGDKFSASVNISFETTLDINKQSNIHSIYVSGKPPHIHEVFSVYFTFTAHQIDMIMSELHKQTKEYLARSTINELMNVKKRLDGEE